MRYRLEDLSPPPPLPDNAADWEAEKRRIAAVWNDYIGGVPEPVPVRYEVLDETAETDHIRRHIRYDTVHGDNVTAYLLLPKNTAKGGNGKRAAIMALHPTAEAGKADVATPAGRDNRRYGLELVARGYVVLAPDTITAGERIAAGEKPYHTAAFYKRHPDWTAVGKMIADHRQGVSLLASLHEVDPQRIGAIGHSLGGYNAIFLAVADPRIRAVVSSCGFGVFAGDPDPNRWGQRDWFSHIPRLTRDLQAGRVPFEFHEIAALAAPVPLYVWSGQQDRIFPNWREIAEAMEQLNNLYAVLGAPEKLVFRLGNTGHDFPDGEREAAYRFLDRWLLGPNGNGGAE